MRHRNALEKRRIIYVCLEWNHDSSVVHPVPKTLYQPNYAAPKPESFDLHDLSVQTTAGFCNNDHSNGKTSENR